MVGDQKSSSPLVPPCVPPGLAWSHLIVSPGVGAPLPLLCTLLTPVSAGLGPGLRAESGVSSYSSRVSAAACVREREVREGTQAGAGSHPLPDDTGQSQLSCQPDLVGCDSSHQAF